MADEPFDVVVPLELETGVYAEDLAGWFTADGVVLDFVAPSSDQQQLLAARIRVLATAALEVRRALERLIGRYELEYGEIHHPRRRGEP